MGTNVDTFDLRTHDMSVHVNALGKNMTGIDNETTRTTSGIVNRSPMSNPYEVHIDLRGPIVLKHVLT